MSGRKWGYGPNGERETFPPDAALPDGWAETPAVFWTDEERAAPEWPDWYVHGEGRPQIVKIVLAEESPAEEAPAPVKPRRGRPPKAKA